MGLIDDRFSYCGRICIRDYAGYRIVRIVTESERVKSRKFSDIPPGINFLSLIIPTMPYPPTGRYPGGKAVNRR